MDLLKIKTPVHQKISLSSGAKLDLNEVFASSHI